MIEYVINHWDEIVLVITTTVTAAAAISALTPTRKDDEFFAAVLKVLNVLALNVGHAKNVK